MTTILSFLKNIPSWVWIVAISLILLFFADKNGYNRRRTEDAIRDSTAVHHAQVSYVQIPVNLPAPNSKPIQGIGRPLPEAIAQELKELRARKISDSLKIMIYDSLYQERSKPFEATYEDSVQVSKFTSYPSLRMLLPEINYKPQFATVPIITITLPPEPLEWYQSKEAKVIGGVIGAGLIYGALESEGSTRLYLGMSGVTLISFSFIL